MDLTWHPPSDPEQHPTLDCAATGTRLGEQLRLSGGVPYLPHGALLDRNQQRREHTASICRHTPKVGAVCGKAARTVLADIPQAFSGVISEQRIDARRRDFLRRMPGRAAPIKTHLLVQRLLGKTNSLRNRASSRAQVAPRTRDATRSE